MLKVFRSGVYIPDLELGDGSIGADEIASDAVTTAKILAANVTTAKIADANVTTAKIADDAVTNVKLAPAQIKHQAYLYDFDALGGAVEAITLTDDDGAAQVIPDNACIVGAYVESVASCTSTGSATIKLGITGDDDAFIAATAFDNGEFTAGALTELTAGIPLKTSAAVSVLATVAVETLGAGEFRIFVQYYEGS